MCKYSMRLDLKRKLIENAHLLTNSDEPEPPTKKPKPSEPEPPTEKPKPSDDNTNKMKVD